MMMVMTMMEVGLHLDLTVRGKGGICQTTGQWGADRSGFQPFLLGWELTQAVGLGG